MSKFQKIKNFGSAATVVSYAYFQAFKFPDSMNVHFQCVIQVCRYNCPEPVCPDEGTQASLPTGVQASVTVAPAFSSNSVGPSGLGQLSAPGGPGGPGGPSDTFVVNPRTPSVLPATRARQYRKIPARFNARDGRGNSELFDFSDTNGYSIPHQYNMKNPYYQGYQNHRVKRHEKAMKKANLGEVNTNSTFQVLSPDDVAFKLPSSQNFNESVVQDMDHHRLNQEDQHSICVTLSNTSGILFLTFMTMIIVSLISSSIITARRCWLKRRKFGTSKKVVTKPISVAVPPKKLLELQQSSVKTKKVENSSK